MMMWLEILYHLLFLCLPISFDFRNAGIGVQLPSEPLQILIACLLVSQWKALKQFLGNQFRNPLFLLLTSYVLWGWFDCLFAENALVSIKFALIETLHFIVFFIGMAFILHKKPEHLFTLIVSYSFPFIILLIHGWYQSFLLGFPISYSLAALWPFYDDHTIYGAVTAFLIPFWLYFSSGHQKWNIRKLLSYTVLMLLCVGLFMSFSRAAWLSLLTSALIGFALYMASDKNHFRIALVFISVTLLSAAGLLIKHSQKSEYIKNSTVTNHFYSSFNWTYDVANLERINRYKCALRMIADRPVTGFGFNGYKYNYTKYQRQEEMTRISITDARQTTRKGTGGNSHSEYLEVFANLGLPGFLIWISIVVCSLHQSIQLFRVNRNTTGVIVFASLLTYFIHGMVNSFFHDDKLSSLVWMCFAVLVFYTGKSSEH
jgi:putative inorganic carbon (HCO3(-)) transporter